jgi:hypothetical protein
MAQFSMVVCFGCCSSAVNRLADGVSQRLTQNGKKDSHYKQSIKTSILNYQSGTALGFSGKHRWSFQENIICKP